MSIKKIMQPLHTNIASIAKRCPENICKKYFLSAFGRSNLTYLTTDVMFSGQRFAILDVFFLVMGTANLTCRLLAFLPIIQGDPLKLTPLNCLSTKSLYILALRKFLD